MVHLNNNKLQTIAYQAQYNSLNIAEALFYKQPVGDSVSVYTPNQEKC